MASSISPQSSKVGWHLLPQWVALRNHKTIYQAAQTRNVFLLNSSSKSLLTSHVFRTLRVCLFRVSSPGECVYWLQVYFDPELSLGLNTSFETPLSILFYKLGLPALLHTLGFCIYLTGLAHVELMT